MGDDIWEFYAKDMMFESHKEPHYVTQQYIKHLEQERERLVDEVEDLRAELAEFQRQYKQVVRGE